MSDDAPHGSRHEPLPVFRVRLGLRRVFVPISTGRMPKRDWRRTVMLYAQYAYGGRCARVSDMKCQEGRSDSLESRTRHSIDVRLRRRQSIHASPQFQTMRPVFTLQAGELLVGEYIEPTRRSAATRRREFKPCRCAPVTARLSRTPQDRVLPFSSSRHFACAIRFSQTIHSSCVHSVFLQISQASRSAGTSCAMPCPMRCSRRLNRDRF
jgi:hypothetical protein